MTTAQGKVKDNENIINSFLLLHTTHFWSNNQRKTLCEKDSFEEWDLILGWDGEDKSEVQQ